jgi:tRNA1(Val) A37 N6-methylase TrmN6
MVPIINPPFADTAGICAHPTPENKRTAVEVKENCDILIPNAEKMLYVAKKCVKNGL